MKERKESWNDNEKGKVRVIGGKREGDEGPMTDDEIASLYGEGFSPSYVHKYMPNVPEITLMKYWAITCVSFHQILT